MSKNRAQLVAQRQLLLLRLDKLSVDLKQETDSIRAEQILTEMRQVGNALMEKVNNPVPDHEYLKEQQFFAECGK